MLTETLLSCSEIPILDLSHMGRIEAPIRSNARKLAAQMKRSLSEKGLAFIVNHGVPNEKFRKVFQAMDEFCSLPMDVKQKYTRVPPLNDGYVAPGVEQFNRQSLNELRHSFNVTSTNTNVPEEDVPGFKEATISLLEDLKRLSNILLQILAISLDLNTEFFSDIHNGMFEKESNMSTMRIIYYPPIAEVCPEDSIRCGEHADYGTITLLAQDCEGGLEIQTYGGKWKRVGHLPGAILVNTGELLAALTNETYPALRHRVVIPEEPMIRGIGRHSLAFFVHPDNNTPIVPINNLKTTQVNGQTANCGKPVYTAYEHLQMRFQETYSS